MKPLTHTQLNRIKIKDMIGVLKQNHDPNNIFELYQLELLEQVEKLHIKDATDDDVENVEEFFLQHTLGIRYFPSQRKKEIVINGRSKIVPIDYHYGSEDL